MKSKIRIAIIVLATTFLMFGCEKKETQTFVSEGTDSSFSSSFKDEKDAYAAFLEDLYQKKSPKNRIYFAFKDLDNNGVQELIVENAERVMITYYTFRDKVTKIGEDTWSGSTKLMFSDIPAYPGIISFNVGGGLERYKYITVRDNMLITETIWDEDFSGSYPDRERIVEYTTDQQLIEESKKVYKENKLIEFFPLESIEA